MEFKEKTVGRKPRFGKAMSATERTKLRREKLDLEISRGRFQDWDFSTCVFVLSNSKYKKFHEAAWWQLGKLNDWDFS